MTTFLDGVSIAPMMERTDRHCRYFMRLLAPDIRMYTEMVTADAILHADGVARFLDFDPSEAPIALQFGGSDPEKMAKATQVAEPWDYDEYNLNCGCPSDRVRSGSFGACLMAEPDTVADCVRAMKAVTDKPVTVKTRIGINDRDDWEFLEALLSAVVDAGCDGLIIHARKAILGGLSPKQNLNVPPLDYTRVAQVKDAFPHIPVVLNGGVRSTAEVVEHLQTADGVMIGRQAYTDPYWLTELQGVIAPDRDWEPPSREDVVLAMADYAGQQVAAGHRLHAITRHMLGLYTGLPGARAWRRYLSENGQRCGATADVLRDSLDVIREQAA